MLPAPIIRTHPDCAGQTIMLKPSSDVRLPSQSPALAARRPCHLSHLAPLRLSTRLHPAKTLRRKDAQHRPEICTSRPATRSRRGGPAGVKDTRIAECVSHCLELGDSKFRRYDLHSFVVMANHVPVLLTPKIEMQWITRSLKGITARLCNQILQRTKGPFWQQECCDHWCRDDVEFQRIRDYIARNPVKAGLVKKPEEWPWSSAHRLGK